MPSTTLKIRPLIASMLAVAFLCFGAAAVLSQDAPIEDPPVTDDGAIGVYLKGPDGVYTQVTRVSTSMQMGTLISEVATINVKLDKLLESREVASLDIQINTATYDQILEIPGIGKVKAGSLITARDVPIYRPFESWQNLMERVSGIGPSTVADMKAAGVTIGTPEPASP